MGRFCLLLIALLLASPVFAAWQVAESPHFRVHARTSAEALRADAAELEDFHRLLQLVTGRDWPKDAPKLDIYLLERREQLRILEPDVSPYAAGFYRPSDTAILAVAVRSRGATAEYMPARPTSPPRGGCSSAPSRPRPTTGACSGRTPAPISAGRGRCPRRSSTFSSGRTISRPRCRVSQPRPVSRLPKPGNMPMPGRCWRAYCIIRTCPTGRRRPTRSWTRSPPAMGRGCRRRSRRRAPRSGLSGDRRVHRASPSRPVRNSRPPPSGTPPPKDRTPSAIRRGRGFRRVDWRRACRGRQRG